VGLAGVLAFVAVRAKAPPDIGRLVPAAAAGIGGIAGLTAFYRGLAIGTMSIVAPISATGVMVPVIVGVAGGDRPSAIQVAGIASAIVGVVLASREHEEGMDRQQAGSASIVLSLIAALGFGSFFVGLRSGARADVAWALVASRSAGVVVLGLAAAARPPARVRDRRATIVLVVMGGLDLSANAFYALATRHGLLSVVAVAASLYPLATVLLARVILGERVRRVQEAGIVAALTGVLLIAAG
jgi:drug/metabolite transporter (DMT)-like permease